MPTSVTFNTEAFASGTAEVVVILVTIDHADLDNPIYLCSNTEEIVSLGRTFIPFGFSIELPNSEQNSSPVARIEIENVSREISQTIEQLSGPPVFSFEIVLASTPDFIEQSYYDFLLTETTITASKIVGILAPEDFTREPCPSRIMDPAGFPGVHQ